MTNEARSVIFGSYQTGPELTGPRSRKGLSPMLRKLLALLAVVALVALATLATAVKTVTPTPVSSDLAVALASE